MKKKVSPYNCLEQLTKSTDKERYAKKSGTPTHYSENFFLKQHADPLYIRAIFRSQQTTEFLLAKDPGSKPRERALPQPLDENHDKKYKALKK